MNFVRWTAFVLALTVISLAGCQKKPEKSGTDTGGTKSSATKAPDSNTTAAPGSNSETALVAATILCGKCGEVKGSDKCCAAGIEVCSCGMHKDSALCCVQLPADAVGKDICKTCGHVAEEGHTCDTDCEKCADCGLHKDSPACCKLKS